jgi:hypothetical protein
MNPHWQQATRALAVRLGKPGEVPMAAPAAPPPSLPPPATPAQETRP